MQQRAVVKLLALLGLHGVAHAAPRSMGGERLGRGRATQPGDAASSWSNGGGMAAAAGTEPGTPRSHRRLKRWVSRRSSKASTPQPSSSARLPRLARLRGGGKWAVGSRGAAAQQATQVAVCATAASQPWPQPASRPHPHPGPTDRLQGSISYSGSSVRLTRIVSPSPSMSSAPMPMALFMRPSSPSPAQRAAQGGLLPHCGLAADGRRSPSPSTAPQTAQPPRPGPPQQQPPAVGTHPPR